MAKSSGKPSSTSSSDRAERFDALAAHEYEHDGETRTAWLRVGRAFPNANGGFTVRLRAVPAATNGEVVVIVKKRDPKDDKHDDFDLP